MVGGNADTTELEEEADDDGKGRGGCTDIDANAEAGCIIDVERVEKI